MRAAAILGLGSSTHDLMPFQSDRIEWSLGLPASRERLDAVLIFGGDGTVHRHLAALVKLALPVLLVPAGSGNDFARALGLFRRRDSLEAWAAFVADRRNVRALDLGVITLIENRADIVAEPVPEGDAAMSHRNEYSEPKQRPNDSEEGLGNAALDGRGRPSLHRQAEAGTITYFSCAAGVGLDGEIARRANALPRWLRAHGGYALSLPAALLRFRPFVLQLATAESDQSEFTPRTPQSITAVVFANTPVYGGGMKIAPRAKLNDGQLDVCLIRDISKLKLLSVFPSVYFGRHLGLREVEYFSAPRVHVETEHPLDVYADGEYVCRTPVEIGVSKSALQLIVPN